MAKASSSAVHIVATGAANLASVIASVQRLGAAPVLTEDPDAITTADRLILPGVGAFGAAMTRLIELRLAEPLRRRIANNQPTLAICLGLQLLFESSDETPGVSGLAAFPGHIQRFPDSPEARIPHMGWNTVTPEPDCALLQSGAAYFANSYILRKPPPDTRSARTEHAGATFISAFERGPLLACQFHPELSGRWGHSLLQRWLTSFTIHS